MNFSNVITKKYFEEFKNLSINIFFSTDQGNFF